MRRHVKIGVAGLLALLVLGLALWRLWPHSLARVIPAEESAVTSLACAASISSLGEDGGPRIEQYQLQALTRDDAAFTAVMEILTSCEYRQDFRNLLPWAVTSFHSEGGRSAQVFLVWGGETVETCHLVFTSDGQVVVSQGSDDGFQVYHAAKDGVLDRLVDYLQEYGVKG